MKPKRRVTSALKPTDELLKITVATAITKMVSAHDVQQFQLSDHFYQKDGLRGWVLRALCCSVCRSVACGTVWMLQN